MSTLAKGEGADPVSIRAQAAALFAAVGRNEKAGATAQLHCLAAVIALRAATSPVPVAAHHTNPDRLIESALRILGSLPAREFAQRDVLVAAAHGRRALRAPR